MLSSEKCDCLLICFACFERAQIRVVQVSQSLLRYGDGQVSLINAHRALFAADIGLGWQTASIDGILDPNIIALVLNRALFICLPQVYHSVFIAQIRHGQVPLHQPPLLTNGAEIDRLRVSDDPRPRQRDHRVAP